MSGLSDCEGVANLEELSGWLLPDGTWHACEDWWHISALYDLIESGNVALKSAESQQILQSGDEETIRNHVASLGFVRISRKMMDGQHFTAAQLTTLQTLLSLLDLDIELAILTVKPGQDSSTTEVRHMTIGRILKLRNPELIFLDPHSDKNRHGTGV